MSVVKDFFSAAVVSGVSMEREEPSQVAGQVEDGGADTRPAVVLRGRNQAGGAQQ